MSQNPENQIDYNAMQRHSNFFSNIETPQQNYPNLNSQNIYTNPGTNNMYNQNIINSQSSPNQAYVPYNQMNAPYMPNNPQPEKKSFFEKVNNAATGVFSFIKEKTPSLPSLPKNILSKEDPMTVLVEINPQYLDEVLKESSFDVNCQILTKSKINDQTIISELGNPRQVNKSLFSTSYILYDISTPQLGWVVSRRYSDFIWLRECLQKLFPVSIIPQIPKKKIGNKRFEEEFVKKRAKGLQNFLKEVLNNEEFKTAEPLLTFLSCIDRAFFESQMKLMDPKILAHETCASMRTFDGSIKIADFSRDNVCNSINYYTNVNTYLQAQNDTLKLVTSNLKGYRQNMAAACNNLEEIEKAFVRLKEMATKVNAGFDILNNFEQYTVFFKNWKRIQINQTCVIKEEVSNFFKDIRNKNSSFLEVLEREEKLKEDFNYLRQKLLSKKEQLWNQKDISKWELNQLEPIDSVKLFQDKVYAFDKMCFKETYELKQKSQLLGYYYYELQKNLKKLFADYNMEFKKNLADFSNAIQPSLTDGITVWSNIASNIK